MARPKKVRATVDGDGNVEKVEQIEEAVPTPIAPLSIDYPNEGLNDIARKINEIIMRLD